MIDDLDGSSSTLRLLLWQALRTYPTDSLLKLLDDDDYIVRTAVARDLQMRGGVDVWQWASNQRSSKRVARRELAAFILGQLGTPDLPFRDSSVPLLKRLAGDSDEEVRAAAIAGLGHLRASEAADVVVEASRDGSTQVRQCAAAALASLNPSEAVRAALRELLHDGDARVREWAACGLAEFEQQ